ncbi:hypothetical protein CDD81_7290 [Ophiocordyceps australis]|uniref:Thioesterase domain-containing protein n=1 Tax=Ophiocordyceps australis TaxID=1399860 RepID=A0A2C5Y4Z2_9HYPO|nr:hypothetical protein CDD81_7290 [Ophiocordyceps australis]
MEASLEEKTRVERLDQYTYAAELSEAFCVGMVPHGGYVASIFLRAAREHATSFGQPDAIAVHWQFLSKTAAGRAVLRIDEVRKGRAMSVLHVSLFQGKLPSEAPWVSPSTEPCVVAYITCRDIASESGISLPTNWSLPLPPPPANLSSLPRRLAGDKWSPFWARIMDVLPPFRSLEYYCPADADPLRPHLHLDFWLRLSQPNARFSETDLGFLADAVAPLILESYRPGKHDTAAPYFPRSKAFWYPTITMSLDVKKKLPPGGAEWLRIHTEAKVIRNGRLDSEVIMFDSEGDVVALSHHVAMIVDVERNFGPRDSAKSKSKM